MTEVQEQFAGLRPVALESVEQELEKLWRETNAQIATGSGPAVARNSVMTLVAVTTTRDHAAQLLNIIHGLSAQHPSRAIIVAGESAQKPQGMQPYIGTYLGDNASFYGEDILIEAEGDAVHHLPGVILPLIVSGLPSVLWWTGEPPWHSEMLESLVDGSDRFIVDTSEMTRVEQSVRALDDLMRRKSVRCAIGDMSWTAQSPWRDIVAGFFDPPEVRPYLDGIERVTIEYAAADENEPVNASQAHLFAGWLASRLGWRINVSHAHGLDANRELTLHDGLNRTVGLEITARYGIPQHTWWEREARESQRAAAQSSPGSSGQLSMPWVRCGALMSVHITSRGERGIGTFAVARESDLAHATTACQVPGIALPSQTIHLQSVGEREPLAEQLRNLGHDPVYEDALAATAQLLGANGRRSGL
jgi:glucose-6-phosphate dehydrogenase assembly protein OpcA